MRLRVLVCGDADIEVSRNCTLRSYALESFADVRRKNRSQHWLDYTRCGEMCDETEIQVGVRGIH